MRKKAKLLPALAFSIALVPVAEIAAIVVAARHDVAVSSRPNQQHSTTAEIAMVQDPFFPSTQPAHTGAELIMINSTPVWVHIH